MDDYAHIQVSRMKQCEYHRVAFFSLHLVNMKFREYWIKSSHDM